MNKSFLYYVTSPFQLSSAISHCKENGIQSKSVFLVVLGRAVRQKNYKSMQGLLKLLPHSSEVEVIELNSKYLDEIIFIHSLLRLKIKYRSISHIFSGDYRDLFGHVIYDFLKLKRYTLLDDGAATLVVIDRYITNGIGKPIINGRYNKIRSNIYRIFGFKLCKEKSININTIFNGKEIIKKSASSIDSLPRNILFVGQKCSESGILNITDEVDAIIKVKNSIFFGRDFSYVPHRDDSIVKISKLEELDVNIVYTETTIEDYMKNQDSENITLVGFWSTALYTCGLEFELNDIYSINILDKISNYEIKDNCKVIYSYFEKVGIKILNIKDE